MLKFTTEEVCALTKISITNLKSILRTADFKPEWPSQGKRQRNYYSAKDVELLKRYMAIKPKYSVFKEKNGPGST